MGEVWNCSVRAGRFVEPCDGLRQATSARADEKKLGVIIHDLVNLKTRKPSRTYFTIRSGEYAKSGIVVNFCPFCGARIDAPVAEEASGG